MGNTVGWRDGGEDEENKEIGAGVVNVNSIERDGEKGERREEKKRKKKSPCSQARSQ